MARLIVVILFAILMYIYQAGVLVPRGVDQLMDDNAIADVAAPAAPAAAAGHQDDQQLAAADVDRGNHQAPVAAAVAGVRRRGSNEEATERNGLRMVWLVVSSLFTSLIPEQPPAAF